MSPDAGVPECWALLLCVLCAWWTVVVVADWLGPELQSLSGAEFVMPTIGLVGRTGWLALG